MDGTIVCSLPKTSEQSLRYDTPRNPKIIKLSEQQNHKCCYCGCRTFLNEDDRNGLSNLSLATIDHVKAKINGGSNISTNTVMCCQKCNTLKSSVDAMIYYYFIQNLTETEFFRFTYDYSIKDYSSRLKEIAETDILVPILAWLWTVVPSTKKTFNQSFNEALQENAKNKQKAQASKDNSTKPTSNIDFNSLLKENKKSTKYWKIPKWLVICHCIILAITLILLVWNQFLLHHMLSDLDACFKILGTVSSHVTKSISTNHI